MEIPEGKYLGKLCFKGHDWEGTGKSLRYESSRICIICSTERTRRWRDDNHEEYIGKQRVYRKNNASHLRELERMRYYKNPQKAKEIAKKKHLKYAEKEKIYSKTHSPIYYQRHKEECKNRAAIGKSKSIKELQNCYVTEKLKRTLKPHLIPGVSVSQIPQEYIQEMVEIHRVLIQGKRKLKQKEGQNV